MAEIVISHVLGRSEPSGRQFFCHGCQKKFTHRVPDPSSVGSHPCPACGSEFVEEVEQEEQRTVGGDSLGSTGATAMDTDPEVERITTHSDGFRRRTTTATQTADTNDATAQFMSQTSRLGRLREQSGILGNEFVIGITPPPRPFGAIIHEHIQRLIDEHEGRRPNDNGSNNPPSQGNQFQAPPNPQSNSHPRPFPPQFPADSGRSATDFHLSVGLPWFLMTQAQERERERERMRRYQRLHRVTPAPPPQMPRFGGPPQIFIGGIPVNVGLHGTPGDYAWGPQGLDNIITQLLATFEDNGPPPADTKKVEELPFVQATEEDLKPCAECSVCKEPFTVGENLRQLPCFHLYHNDCILPWLKLHDTCPTCRFSINTGKPADD